MIIRLKNKDTLNFDDFSIKCVIGKNGLNKNKKEGDKSTPIGNFKLGPLYWRADKIDKPETNISCKKINKNLGWCNDIDSRFYNKEIKVNKKIKHEKWDEKKKNEVQIHQNIYVNNSNHKKIILGKNGDKIKQISMQARQEIERHLGKKIHLFLFIKQKKKNTAIELIE